MTRQLLRIATAGSVDDGKSTLIGRLLHDTDSLPWIIWRPSPTTKASPISRRCPTGCGPNANRASPSTWHTGSSHRVPQLHPGRHTRARALHAQHVHQRVQRAHGPFCSSMLVPGAAPDPPARPHRETILASNTLWRRSTRSTWSVSTLCGSVRWSELRLLADRLGISGSEAERR